MRFLSPQSLAGASARHPWRTLAAWVLLLAVVTVLGNAFSGPMTGEGSGFTNDPDSQVANERIETHFGADSTSSETIVVHSDTLTVDDPAFREVVDGTIASLQPWEGDIAELVDYYALEAAGVPEASALVSADRHALIIPVTLSEDDDAYEERGDEWIADAQAAATGEVAVYAVGDISGNATFGAIAEEDLSKEVSVGLPVAGLVLLVVFSALLAPILPLAIGVVSIAVTSGFVLLLANALVLDSTTLSLVSMIGLAVGIDYALFFFERFREERRQGARKMDAIERAGGSAGKAVMFSGATVILALLGLLLLPINFFQGMGISAALVVVVAVAAAMTLLPAMVRLIGDWANAPRFGMIRKLRRQDRTGYAEFEQKIGSGLWGHLASAVMRRPVAWLVASLAILLLLAAPVLSMNIGSQETSSLPDTDFTRGYDVLAADFSAGMDYPVRIVAGGDANDPERVETLVATLEADDAFGGVTTETSPDGAITVIDAVTKGDPFSHETEALVKDLRGDVVPAVFGADAGEVHITGATAETIDFNGALIDSLPTVFAFVLGLSFVLLMVAFRSLLVPLTSILMNILSVAAAYGALVLVFQYGVGASLFGFTEVDTITNWLPVMLFCILFGLSMDYHVFLLSRVREHYDHTGDNEEAVRVGLQQTGRLITGAALIMVAVFASFAGGRLVEMQQMGFGLAFAVLIDATLIRTILVPAVLKLSGRANWYFPRALRWLPDVRVEGDLAPIRLPRRPAGSQPAGWSPAPAAPSTPSLGRAPVGE
jgi:RND superfamily putative drug exporter